MNSARELADQLLRLLRREQGAMADFLVALADFDDRRLWLKLGHSSLFTFLHFWLGDLPGGAGRDAGRGRAAGRRPECEWSTGRGRRAIHWGHGNPLTSASPPPTASSPPSSRPCRVDRRSGWTSRRAAPPA